MTKQGDRSYKRSWKNLLINKRYQLSFTLFMVGLATVLMVGLGFFVMHVANETTKVSKTSERGKKCPSVPSLEAPPEDEPLQPPPPPMKLDEPPKPGTAAGAGSGSAGSGSAEPGHHGSIDVQLEPMRMEPTPLGEPPKPKVEKRPEVPEKFGELVVAKWTCELAITNKVGELERGRLRILYVLVAIGFVLILGLAAYGIKMTHRVAGPLFKVQLYLAKMRDGRFDKVYNLRKGDQLVDFYDHFKHAHEGITRREQVDIERLKSLIAAAEAAGSGDHASIAKLRELVARKEKSLE